MPELSGQTVTDIYVNPLDSICNSHVTLSENEDFVVSPTVVSSPPTILRRSQRNQWLNLTCNGGFAL